MLGENDDGENDWTGIKPHISTAFKLCDTILTSYTLALGLLSVVDITGTTAVSVNQYSILLWAWAALAWGWVFLLLTDGLYKWSRSSEGSGVPDYVTVVRPLVNNAIVSAVVSVITAAMTQYLLSTWSTTQLNFLEQRNLNPWPAANHHIFLNFALIEVLVIFGMFWSLKHVGWLLCVWIVPEMIPQKYQSDYSRPLKASQGKRKLQKKRSPNYV